MRKLLLAFLLILPTIVFAQGTTTQIRRGATLPTTCVGGDIFIKSGSSAGFYFNVASGTCSWVGPTVLNTSSDIRGLWSGTCDSSTYLRGDGSCFAPPGTGTPGGSDTHVQYNDGGAFGGESNFVWDKTNHKLSIGNGSTQGTMDFRGGTSAPSNPSANYCRQYFNTTSGVMEWINSSGSSCGPTSGGSGTVTSSGSPSSGNIAKFTSSTDIAPAAASNVVALFNSGTCSGYLKSDGTCDTPAGGGTTPDWVTQSVDLTPGSPNALDDEFASTSLSGSWTQTNVGSTVFTEANSFLTFAAPTNSGDSIRQLWKATPSAPYEFEAKLLVEQYNGSTSGYHLAGFCLNDSGTGKIISFAPGFRADNANTGMSVIYWNSQTSFNSYAYSATPFGQDSFHRWMYIKVKNDNTNLIFSGSYSGASGSFTTLFTVAKGAFLTTIDRIGICADVNDTSNVTTAVFDFFRRTL
jgi:hypothetical protein